MSIITLTEAKKHLNIDEEFTEDDNYIQSLIDVAENLIENDTQKVLSSFSAIPPVLKHAAKILISTFYENREAVVIGTIVSEVPFSYKYLIGGFKKWTIA